MNLTCCTGFHCINRASGPRSGDVLSAVSPGGKGVCLLCMVSCKQVPGPRQAHTPPPACPYPNTAPSECLTEGKAHDDQPLRQLTPSSETKTTNARVSVGETCLSHSPRNDASRCARLSGPCAVCLSLILRAQDSGCPWNKSQDSFVEYPLCPRTRPRSGSRKPLFQSCFRLHRISSLTITASHGVNVITHTPHPRTQRLGEAGHMTHDGTVGKRDGQKVTSSLPSPHYLSPSLQVAGRHGMWKLSPLLPKEAHVSRAAPSAKGDRPERELGCSQSD